MLQSVTGTTQELVTQDLAGGGGSSWAWTTLWKVERLCEPSQKGLRSEKPQRQRPILVRPPRPYAWPSWSTTSTSPSISNGPLFTTVTFTSDIRSSDRDTGNFGRGRAPRAHGVQCESVFGHRGVHIIGPCKDTTL